MIESPRVNHSGHFARPALWLAAAAVASAWGALYDIGRWTVLFVRDPAHLDFRIFYVAARAGLMYGWPRMYDLATLRSLSSSFPAGQNYVDSSVMFASPPVFAWLISPFTALSLPVAYVLWTLVSLGALVWTWHLAAPYHGLAKVTLLLLALALWPVMDAFYWGQPSIVILALVATSWWLCGSDRQWAGGAALALATALKPQVVILVPVALLVCGRRRAFAGWAVASFLLGGASVVALGQQGLSTWWQALQYLQSNGGHSFFTMARIFGAGPVTYGVEAILGLGALAIAWRRRGELEMVYALGLLGSVVVAFHLHQPDYSNLVLAAWFVLRTSPPMWHRLWLVTGIATMQLITLGQPIPQLVWDTAWVVFLGISSFAGSGASAPATPSPVASGARAGT